MTRTNLILKFIVSFEVNIFIVVYIYKVNLFSGVDRKTMYICMVLYVSILFCFFLSLLDMQILFNFFFKWVLWWFRWGSYIKFIHTLLQTSMLYAVYTNILFILLFVYLTLYLNILSNWNIIHIYLFWTYKLLEKYKKCVYGGYTTFYANKRQ